MSLLKDFENGDSGIYDSVERENGSRKQKNAPASVIVDADADDDDVDEKTKELWRSVTSASAFSIAASRNSIGLSNSTFCNVRRKRFQDLRSNVGNKWASFSSSFFKVVGFKKNNLMCILQ